ncbi:MAG: cytochrome b/b6 domain-containing protein [Hyphomicrobiales bacterium]
MSDHPVPDDTELRKIWDLPTRIFHWALVIVVCTGWYLGQFGPFLKTWHIYCGYTVGALLVFRLIWGFAGGRASRFASFIHGPRAILGYMAHMFRRVPSHWPGHNPMGGWSAIAMLVSLMVQVGTGLFTDDDIANSGPFAAYVGKELRGELTALHHLNSKLILALVVLHVAVIVFYRLWKHENLVRPMITGWKAVKPKTDAPAE